MKGSVPGSMLVWVNVVISSSDAEQSKVRSSSATCEDLSKHSLSLSLSPSLSPPPSLPLIHMYVCLAFQLHIEAHVGLK